MHGFDFETFANLSLHGQRPMRLRFQVKSLLYRTNRCPQTHSFDMTKSNIASWHATEDPVYFAIVAAPATLYHSSGPAYRHHAEVYLYNAKTLTSDYSRAGGAKKVRVRVPLVCRLSGASYAALCGSHYVRVNTRRLIDISASEVGHRIVSAALRELAEKLPSPSRLAFKLFRPLLRNLPEHDRHSAASLLSSSEVWSYCLSELQNRGISSSGRLYVFGTDPLSDDFPFVLFSRLGARWVNAAAIASTEAGRRMRRVLLIPDAEMSSRLRHLVMIYLVHNWWLGIEIALVKLGSVELLLDLALFRNQVVESNYLRAEEGWFTDRRMARDERTLADRCWREAVVRVTSPAGIIEAAAFLGISLEDFIWHGSAAVIRELPHFYRWGDALSGENSIFTAWPLPKLGGGRGVLISAGPPTRRS